MNIVKNPRKTPGLLVLVAALCAAALGGCDFLMGPDNPATETTLVISFTNDDSAARSVTSSAELKAEPGLLDALRYKVKLTGPDGEAHEYTLTGGERLEMKAALGRWRVYARAFLPGDDVNVVGTGQKDFTVSSGKNPVHVTMTMATGTTIYTITPYAGPDGTVTAYPPFAYPGTTVTLTATLGAEYLITLDNADLDYTTYSFTMPSNDVTITPVTIADYLASASGGAEADPVPLRLAAAFDASTDWTSLLTAINTASKYVALDLSACALSGGLFDPYIATATGEGYITALTLPEAATEIAAGNSTNPTFKHFTALKEVHGGNLATVGNYAFYYCSSLTGLLDLPLVTSIGNYAFGYCTGLTELNLPQVVTIGTTAFRNCAGLTELNLPQVVSIGDAFFNCAGLTELSLPLATTIGSQAFQHSGLTTLYLPKVTNISDSFAFADCTDLTEVNLPLATTIGQSAFANCTSLTEVNIPMAANIRYSAFYNTGDTALTITLGAAPPTVLKNIFSNVSSPGKTVTVRVPSAALDAYGSGISGADTTTQSWANAFRGMGWDSGTDTYGSVSDINTYITVDIVGY